MQSVEHLVPLGQTSISIDQSTSSAPSCSAQSNGTESGKWRIGTLIEKDFDAVCAICKESFPLDYPQSWFQEVVTGKFISFGLYYGDEDRDLCIVEQRQQQSYVLYILSLAVKAEFRRKGVATILLQHLMRTAVRRPPYPKMVFLHVLSKNYAAISFYKQNGFKHHSTLLNYYQIVENGLTVYYDGFTFVIYTNGGASPWSSRELCNLLWSIICAPFRLLFRLKSPFRSFSFF
uniref:N-alpha-acetyltransferase 60 n=1 Tax=Ditylenchus dipsaci TaxID=166011 RepID=A0A915DMH1_9BILA